MATTTTSIAATTTTTMAIFMHNAKVSILLLGARVAKRVCRRVKGEGKRGVVEK